MATVMMLPTIPSVGPQAERLVDDIEQEFLRRTQGGDSKAFECLYDLYSRPVYSLALRIVRDPHAAQDVAQDVFLAIWRGAGNFDACRGSVRSWILALAHHKSVDAARRGRVRAAGPLGTWLGAEFDAAEEGLRRVERAQVRHALAQLPAAQREAIALAFFEGYTQREVADRLGVPLGTVKTRIRDGMLRLRDALGGFSL